MSAETSFSLSADLAVLLSRHALFNNLEEWRVTPVAGFELKPVHRFQLGPQDYFIKRVKATERRTLGLIATLDLAIAPRVIAPELLHENVLVAEYVAGRSPRDKWLDRDLIDNYTMMQNVLNDKNKVPNNCPWFEGGSS